jgi:hypothetical protein
MRRRIRSEILKKKRVGYGEEILATVSQELTKEYRLVIQSKKEMENE